MFRIIGSAVVILSATLFGMRQYNTYFERKKTLQDMLDGCRLIESKLMCLHAPLHESFMGSGDFFENARTQILSGLLPEEAVRNTAYELHFLKKEDIGIIERFASGLCASSCDGQLSNLGVFKAELERVLEEATGELNLKGKLCVKGSILAAAAIVLLLI